MLSPQKTLDIWRSHFVRGKHQGWQMGTAQSASAPWDSDSKTRVNSNLTISWWLEMESSLHSQRKNTNLSRKPKSIPRMLLVSLRLSVVVLTLWRCEMGANSSTAVLRHHNPPRLKWRYSFPAEGLWLMETLKGRLCMLGLIDGFFAWYKYMGRIWAPCALNAWSI